MLRLELLAPDTIDAHIDAWPTLRRVAILAWAALLLAGCGKDPTRPDTNAPASIVDLTLIAVEDSSVILVWTAPGDDGDRGTAAAYDLRLSTDPSTPFEVRAKLDGAPRPGPAGTRQVAILRGRSFVGDFFFQMKTADESGNWSAVSNQAMTRDQVPPAAVSDLAATTTGPFKVRVTWTSPGDDGAVGGKVQGWELRYTTDPNLFDTEAGWDAATAVSGLPSPAWPGNPNQMDVSLTINTTYYLALRSTDDAGNKSNLSNVVRVRTEELPAALLEEWRDSRIPQYAASIQRDRSGGVYVASEDRIVRMDARGNVVSVRNGIGGRLALDPDGNLYALRRSVSGASPSLVRYSNDGTELFRWRSPDSYYRDLAIDGLGTLFLLDQGKVEVLRPVAEVTKPPILVNSWSITNPGLDGAPPFVSGGIAATKDFVYVMIDYQKSYNIRTTSLQKYSKGGTLIANTPLQWTISTRPFLTLSLCSSDDQDNLYVLDSSNGAVMKLDAAGSVRMRVSSGPDGAGDVVAAEGRMFVLEHLLSGAGSFVKVYGPAPLAARAPARSAKRD